MTRPVVLIAIAILSLACSTRGGPSGGGGGGDAGLPDASFPDVRRPDAGGPVRTDGGPSLEDVLVYAHSRDTLYSFSPSALNVTEVGPFRLPGGDPAPYMLDLAVDSEGRVFTSSDTSLFRVDPDTAVATEIGTLELEGDRLYALTFLAAGEYGPSETLIGAANGGAYYEVDPDTAATSYLGQYPDGWRSSGDLVSVAGLGTFATVRRDDFPSDVLVQILFSSDGSSTAIVKGPIRDDTRDFRQLFGLGYWGRVLYGFSNDGELVEIDRDSGAGSLVSTSTGTSQFWGAGVTTRVPVLF